MILIWFGVNVRSCSHSHATTVSCKLHTVLGHEQMVGEKGSGTFTLMNFSTFSENGYRRHLQNAIRTSKPGKTRGSSPLTHKCCYSSCEKETLYINPYIVLSHSKATAALGHAFEQSTFFCQKRVIVYLFY